MKKTFLFPLIALCAAFFATLAGCSNINTHHETTSVSFTLDGAKFISALPSSRNALLARGGTDTEDGDEDWLEKEDLREKLFVRVALFGDGYAATKTEEWMIAEEDTDVEFKTMTFDEVPVGKSVKARVVAYITSEATGQDGEKISYTYPVALGESNSAKVEDGTTTLEMPVTLFEDGEHEEPLMGSVSGKNDCTYMLMRYATGETTGVYMITCMYNSDDESDIISVGAYTFNESTHSVAVSEYACLADKGTQFNILTRTNTQTLDLTSPSLSVTSAHGETIVFENGEPDDDALFTAHGTVSYTYLGQTVSAACVFSANSVFTYTIESEAITYTLGDTSITIFPAGTISGGTYALSGDITEETATLTLVEGWYYDPLKSEKVTIDTSEEKSFDISSGTFTYTSESGLSIEFTIDGLEPKTEYSFTSDISSGEYDGTLTFELYSDLTYNITYLASEADGSSDGIVISKGYYGASANLSIRVAISDKVDVYETAYRASLSDTELTEVENPTAQTIDLTSSTFTFTSGSRLEMSFGEEPTIASIKMQLGTDTLDVGSSTTVTVTATYSDATEKTLTDLSSLSVKSADESIATAAVANGVLTVTGVNAGTTKITISYEGYSETCTVTVLPTTVTVGSVTVTLATLSTTDEGENVTLTATTDSGIVTLSATPATGTTVSAYAWIIDGSAVDGATEATYILTEDVLSGLTSGIHNVTCVVTIDGELYSVRTTFTVE